MKFRVVILILFLAAPMTVQGHTEIFFPKLFSLAELPNTGFVLLNPDPAVATVYFYLISAGGLTVSSGSLTIAPGGQVARLGSELFPNPATGGWIYILNDTEGMQALWQNYDAGLTFLDGAEAAQYDTIGADQIIPLAAGDAELNVINPNFQNSTLTIRLFGSNGEIAPAFIGQLAIAGGFQSQVSSMFPSADMTQARYIRVRSSGFAIASSVMIRGFLVPTESVVVNGVNVSTRTDATFPHVVNGVLAGANYTTVIGLTNASSGSQTVTITYNIDGGGSIVAARTIPANGALRETAQSLFGLSPDFQSGWVRASGTAAIVGFAGYADTLAGAIGAVPAGVPQTNLFFSHIADGPPQWQTGLAFLNPGSAPASVEVYAVDPSGALIGRAGFTLNPGQEIANVIHEWIPQARGVNGGYVYVRTPDNTPIFGIELFYTEDLKVLCNVAAGKLVSGVRYTPPSP